MCWSFEASLGFAVAEALMSVFLWVRSRRSTHPYIRRQWMAVPSLVTVCLIEALEAYIWYDHDQSLQSIYDATASGCSAWNRRFTTAAWLVLIPCQPLWVLLPCRRGHGPPHETATKLQVSEFLALAFAICHTGLYVYSLVVADENDKWFVRRNLADSDYKGYLHTDTCTYVGRSGHHLHWTYNMVDTFLLPNAFGCLLLWLSLIFARPYQFCAGIYILVLVLFGAQLVYFEMSFEAGSVWCWSGMILYLYFILQPHVWPVEKTMEKTTTTIAESSTQVVVQANGKVPSKVM